MKHSLFISTPKDLEYLLEEEVKALGLQVKRVSPQGVYAEASLALIYELCLWSRLASRIQLLLFSTAVSTEAQLYQSCLNYPWHELFTQDKSIAIDFHGSSPFIRNSMYGAQRVKDGIVDYFRSINQARPRVAKEKPDIRLHAHLKNEQLSLSLDLTGYSLHQRAYRIEAGPAPLKENLAAALLLRMKWPALAASGAAFHDPLCGSGTLVIEAAMMAAHIAPGLLRQDQAIKNWRAFDANLWEAARLAASKAQILPKAELRGNDSDEQLIQLAQRNAARAGVGSLVEFTHQSLEAARPSSPKGLLLTNPPYGERLSDEEALIPLYQNLGRSLHEHFPGWKAGILSSNLRLAKAIGLRSQKQYSIYNGPIKCTLYTFNLDANNKFRAKDELPLSEGASMLFNRLEKNYSHLKKWAKKNHISCYRLYDADLPEYAFAVDLYADQVVLQEYAPPSSIPEFKAKKRAEEMRAALSKLLQLSTDQIILKERRKQKGLKQYQKIDATEHALIVTEGAARFKVNLHDYLDTGLFLDHRPLRLNFAKLEKGMTFLNLFCYTASASVHAALAGAYTSNVDLSKTYLRWAEDNFRLNQIDCRRHQFIAMDCMTWLSLNKERYDCIFLDPPSFSNSKSMQGTLDIQRDHAKLIQASMQHLKKDGILYFSTNYRAFKLDESLKKSYQINDISASTRDQDFKRNPKIHYCFKITPL